MISPQQFLILTISLATLTLSSTAGVSKADAAGAPSYSTNCTSVPQRPNLSSQLQITAKSADLHSVKIKNLSQNCVYQVGIASYQAVKAYNTKDWINTQQYFDSQTVSLNPGDEKLLSIKLPSCAYQSDVFQGALMKDFDDNHSQTYGRQGRLLGSYVNYNNRPLCPTGQVLSATPYPTAHPTTVPSKLPKTGPGDSVALSFTGIVAALIAKKFILSL